MSPGVIWLRPLWYRAQLVTPVPPAPVTEMVYIPQIPLLFGLTT